MRRAELEGLEFLPGENFQAIPGRGVEVAIQGQVVLLGNKKLMHDRGLP